MPDDIEVVAEEIAANQTEIGFECDADLVALVANHDYTSEEGPIPNNAALAANILNGLIEAGIIT